VEQATLQRPGAMVSLPLAPVWRVLVGAAGAANLLGAAYLTTQPPGLIDAWPWELTRLSVLFLAAMLAAVGAAAVWIGVSGDGGALPAGFANLTVTGAGVAGWLAFTHPDRRGLAAVIAVLAALNLVLTVVTHRAAVRRAVPVELAPRLVRWSFAVFAVVLAGVGFALIAGGSDVMPWSVVPGTADVFGWIFLGDAVFFAHALVWPTTDRGRSQLWSFLGYDLVLLVPLASTLRVVDPALRPNLVVYLAVLVYSAVLGVWYLVVRPATASRSSVR
jgi:hypothetical protein